MKKFYTIALASAVALSASAGTELKLRTNADFSAKTLNTDAPMRLKKSVKELTNAMPALKKSKKAAADDGIEGTYTITIGDYYWEDSVNGELEEECEVSLNQGMAIFSCDYFPSMTGGAYNETTGTITFSAIELGQAQIGQQMYYVRFEPFTGVTTDGYIISQSYNATYSNGTISFPSEHGFCWSAYTDANYTQLAGYLDAFDVVSLAKKAPEDENAWTSLGNATFMDGWVLPLFDIDQTDPANQYEVELQQNSEDHNLYRLVDPYHGNSPVADLNETDKKGYITFNVANPDHVVFVLTDAGFAYADADLSKMYCYNALTWALDYLGTDDIDTVLNALAQSGKELPATTFKNGVVDLPSTFVNATEGYQSDACFGDQSDKNGGYGWITETKAGKNMAAKIIFPATGIDNVVAGEADAPVKYFNLQGIEVAKPAAGQVVIRKQGNNATKFMAR